MLGTFFSWLISDLLYPFASMLESTPLPSFMLGSLILILAFRLIGASSSSSSRSSGGSAGSSGGSDDD